MVTTKKEHYNWIKIAENTTLRLRHTLISIERLDLPKACREKEQKKH